jgi:branched-chain amino acid transport system substrate-binding protein
MCGVGSRRFLSASVVVVAVLTASVVVGTASGRGARTAAKGAATACTKQLNMKIAAVLALSGPTATAVQPHWNGVTLGVRDAQRTWKNLHIDLIKADSQASPQQAVQAYASIQDQHPTAVIGAPGSSQTQAIGAAVNSAGGILLAPNGFDMRGFGEMSYNLTPPASLYYPRVLKTLWAKIGSKLKTAVYINQPDYPLGVQTNKLVKSLFEKKGVKTVLDATVFLTQTDFSTLAGQIEQLQPSIVVDGSSVSGTLWNAIGRSGYKGLKFSGPGGQVPQYITAANGGMSGAYTPVTWIEAAAKTPFQKKWVSAYASAYGQPPGPFPPPIYDGIQLLSAAAEAACSTDPASVNAKLGKVKLVNGVTASPLKFFYRALLESPTLVQIGNDPAHPTFNPVK